jgi:hypothetical protein
MVWWVFRAYLCFLAGGSAMLDGSAVGVLVCCYCERCVSGRQRKHGSVHVEVSNLTLLFSQAKPVSQHVKA